MTEREMKEIEKLDPGLYDEMKSLLPGQVLRLAETADWTKQHESKLNMDQVFHLFEAVSELHDSFEPEGVDFEEKRRMHDLMQRCHTAKQMVQLVTKGEHMFDEHGFTATIKLKKKPNKKED